MVFSNLDANTLANVHHIANWGQIGKEGTSLLTQQARYPMLCTNISPFMPYIKVPKVI